MRGRVIEQGDGWAAHVAQQFAQEYTDFVLPKVVVEEQVVEAQTMPRWTDRNSRDHGDFVPPSLTVTMHRSLALGSPGSDHGGNQLKIALRIAFYGMSMRMISHAHAHAGAMGGSISKSAHCPKCSAVTALELQ